MRTPAYGDQHPPTDSEPTVYRGGTEGGVYVSPDASGAPVPSSGSATAGSGLSGLPSASAGTSQRFPTPTLHDSSSASTTSAREEKGGGAAVGKRVRARFEPGELAMVCSRFDIGAIEAVKEFRRGSGRSPKVVIRTDRGVFLLKRRHIGRHGLARIDFCHDIQVHLAERRFPLPQLIAPRDQERSMLVIGEQVYELFEFIAGNSYDQSLDATADAGRALGLFHRLLWSFELKNGFQPPRSSYHNAGGGVGERGFEEQLAQVERRLGDAGVGSVLRRLRVSYADAAQRVEGLGLAAWPVQIIHGDWHPGNMLFHGSRIAAVIDYDTARLGPRLVDLANGVLQFSIIMGPGDPRQWPAELDEGRYKRFCRGYETVKDCVISVAELQALPWLMIEALIVEAVVPIAATGNFAGLSGTAFLQSVDTKCAWIQQHAARLTSLLGP